MNKGLITIIVPVYNVEKYLNRCIQSCVNQTYRNLEIVLVDDGSTDNCPQMCDQWGMQDSRINVIHKKNAGLGEARNTGLTIATGEYVCFLDSDDYLEINAIEKASMVVKDNMDVDAVLWGFANQSVKGSITSVHVPQVPDLIYENTEIERYILPRLIAPEKYLDTNLWMSACAGLYSLNTIKNNNWEFVSERNIISEDVYSLLGLFGYMKKIAILSKCMYYYCENETSLTHSFRKDRIEKIESFYDECIKICELHQYSEEVKISLSYPYLSNMIAAMKMITKSNDKNIYKYRIVKNTIKSRHFQRVIKTINFEDEKFQRKILLWFMKKQFFIGCFLLIALKA